MHVLTIENKTYDLNYIPEQVEELRYCVLDCNVKADIDFFFKPMVFIEQFFSPAAVLTIAGRTMKMPLDWSVLICDEDFTEVDIIPLEEVDAAGTHVLLINPLTTMIPESSEIRMVNVHSDILWHFPKIAAGVMLLVPIENVDNPRCAIFVKDMKKLKHTIEISDMF